MKKIDAKCGLNRRIPIIMEFEKPQLKYDIENRAYVHGDYLKNTDNLHNLHQFQDIADEGNMDIVTRFMNKAYAEVLELLYAYTKDSLPGIYCDDNTNDRYDVYRIFMNVPQAMSRHSIELLKEQIHEYIVSRVLAQWAIMTLPESASIWVAKSEDIKNEIKTTHNKRMHRVRIRKSIF